jgi:hypothetical protein
MNAKSNKLKIHHHSKQKSGKTLDQHGSPDKSDALLRDAEFTGTFNSTSKLEDMEKSLMDHHEDENSKLEPNL